MIYIDEIKDLKLYKRPFLLPRNGTDRKRGNVIMLLTPNHESSMNLLKNPFMKNKYYKSYYLERDVSFYINHENNTLSHIEDSDEYIHETVEGNDGTYLNEGVFSHYKEKIIYNGLGADVAKVKKYINCKAISDCNNDLNAHIKYPISVTAYNRTVPAPTDAKSINVVANIGISEEEFRYYCKEEIYTMIIKSINPDVNAVILESSVMTLSGTYDKYGSSFDSEKIPYKFWCEGVKSIISEPGGHKKLYKIIEKNDISTFSSLCAKYNPILKKGIRESAMDEATLDPITRLKRYVHFSSGGKRNLIKKVKDNIERVADPTEQNPEFEIKNTDGTNYDEDRKEDKVDVPTIDYQNPAAKEIISGKQVAPKNEEAYSLYDEYFDEYYINENMLRTDSTVTYFMEAGNAQDSKLRKMLYRERLRTNRQVIDIYTDVKNQNPDIMYTFLNINRYKGRNLIVDLRYYNELFFKNNMYKMDKGINLYYTLLERLINNGRLTEAGYTNKRVVFIPLADWDLNPNTKMWLYNKDINPISLFYRMMQKNFNKLRESFKDIDFVFITDKAYFKLNFNTMKESEMSRFVTLVRKLRSGTPVEDEGGDDRVDSKRAIVDTIVDKIEDDSKVKISHLTGTAAKSTIDMKKSNDEFKPAASDKEENIDNIKGSDEQKKRIIKDIELAADKATDVDGAMEILDNDEYFKKILAGLSDDEDNGIHINNARASRMDKLNTDVLEKSVRGKTVQEILDSRREFNSKELPKTALPIDSINPEWGELTYINASNVYDPNEDIVAMLYDLRNKTYPLSIRDINIEDTSTTEDYIYTYTVDLENHAGKRFKLKFDIPKLVNNQYMVLRGNNKVISSQSFLMPLLKTDVDTVQIISNYNKIFIRRFGTSTGKSCESVDRLIKTINKYGNEIPQLKVVTGDNAKICDRYDLPIDYIDLASIYNTIETPNRIYYFNQKEIREKYKDKIDFSLGTPYGVNKSSGEIMYFDSYNSTWFVSSSIVTELGVDLPKFNEYYDKTTKSVKYTYSKASILSTEIPVIVVAAYTDGLTKVLEKAKIEYRFQEKRPTKNRTDDFIKFKDGYLVYSNNYGSSLLLNGLKECPTDMYSVSEVNSRSMYLDFLDNYGGKIKADGIDNFADCMIDPITKDILEHYNLPTDYVTLLIRANNLLADNKYFKHGDMSARRLRKNEIIAGYAYKALSGAYGSYATSLKHGRDTIMSMKQSAVIDMLLLDPTSSDSSFINPLSEIESYNTVSTKGLSGMNSDRSYSLDKRSYDDSMINVLGMSTNFAGTVGINRQATINANIDTARGYVKESTQNDMNSVNSLCFSEALTPMGTTRDDPFRTAMTFVQTTKHGMRVKHSDPSLVTNGAAAALPYVISDNFAHKAKSKGEVVEFEQDKFMIIKYNDGSAEYVDLSEKIEKNSASGFFQVIKLDTDLKLGSKVKENDIVAYDRLSFNPRNGLNNDIEYNIGTLVKCAMLDTDEGFEDSAIISKALSEAMASDVVLKKEINLPKTTNVYKVLEPGTPIQEGDTLMIMQSPFDEEDANTLLKSLVDDPEEISNLGRISIKSKVTGFVQDIEIYRTVELDELSESLQKLCKKYESKVKYKKNILKKYNINDVSIGADYKLEATGKLKGASDGVMIIFYLKYEDKMSVGDKLVYWSKQ